MFGIFAPYLRGMERNTQMHDSRSRNEVLRENEPVKKISVIQRDEEKPRGLLKKLLTLSAICLLFSLSGCSFAPSIEEVEEFTARAVEGLLVEDNNEELVLRMDRYFLSEKTDELTYVGSLKATALYYGPWHKSVPDSTKLYRTVTIKFRDRHYEHYTITIEDDE